jgi:hypothetical protein
MEQFVSVDGIGANEVAASICAAVGRTTIGSFHPAGTVIGIVKVAVLLPEAMYIRRSVSVVAVFL